MAVNGGNLELVLKPDFNQTDDTFDAGTQTTTDGNNDLVLAKSATGTEVSRTETTQADFQTGTLTDVTASSAGDLELTFVDGTETTTLCESFEDETWESFINGVYNYQLSTYSPYDGTQCAKPATTSGQIEIQFTVPTGYNVVDLQLFYSGNTKP